MTSVEQHTILQNLDKQFNKQAIIVDIDDRINNEVQKSMSKIINQMIQTVGISIQWSLIDNNQQCNIQMVMTVIEQFVNMCEHYEESIVSKDHKHKLEIDNIKNYHNIQLQKCINQKKCAVQELQQKLELLTHKNKQQSHIITSLSSQIENKTLAILNSNRKLSVLQSKIEGYQYQLQAKNIQIANMRNQTAQVMQIIASDLKKKQQNAGIILADLQADFDQFNLKRSELSMIMQKQQQIINVASQIFQLSMQTTHTQNMSQINNYSQQQSEISQSPIRLLANIQQQQLSNTVQTIRESVRSSFNTLLNKYKQLAHRNNNMVHRYSLFLKESQQTMQECKTRIHGLQQDKIKLYQNNERSSKIVEQFEKQINMLKEVISNKVNTHIQKQQQYMQSINNIKQQYENEINSIKQQHKQQIQRLTQQLQNKRLKVSDLQRKLAAEQKLYREHAMQLTIQVQSLKQTISSMQNTIQLPTKQHDDSKQITISADQKDHQQQRQEQKQKQEQESDKQKQTKQECNNGIDAAVLQQIIDKTYEIRLENYQLKCSNQDMQSTISKLQSALKLAQQQIRQKQTQLQKMIKKQQIDEQLRQQRQKQCERLKQQKQSLSKAIQDKNRQLLNHQLLISQLQSEKQQLVSQHQQIKLSQQSYDVSCLPSYEHAAMLKVQVYVLNEIINLMKNGKQSHHVAVQACFGQIDQDQPIQTKRQQDVVKRNITRGRSQSIGCLVNTKKDNILPSFCKDNEQKFDPNICNLNKTCKMRQPQMPPLIPNNTSTQQQQQQVQQLNDIINYMICYLKGYTRNGVRKQSWLSQQGEDYLLRIQSSKNIKQKYGLFQRVRSLSTRNHICGQLVADYQQIANFYFALAAEQHIRGNNTMIVEVGPWENSNNKENLQTTYTKSKHMDSMWFSTHK